MTQCLSDDKTEIRSEPLPIQEHDMSFLYTFIHKKNRRSKSFLNTFRRTMQCKNHNYEYTDAQRCNKQYQPVRCISVSSFPYGDHSAVSLPPAFSVFRAHAHSNTNENSHIVKKHTYPTTPQVSPTLLARGQVGVILLCVYQYIHIYIHIYIYI